MSDTKLLQAVFDRVAAMDRKMDDGFKELKGEIKEIRGEIKEVEERLTGVENGLRGLTKRVDKIGYHLAQVDDDTPTREEFDTLEKRVDNLYA